MSALHIFLLSLAGCVLFSAGLYIERFTRPRNTEDSIGTGGFGRR